MPAQVQHAIRQMGTDALPRLIELLHKRPFVAKQKIYSFLNDKVGLDLSDDFLAWQVRSVQALQALGPTAKPALSELTRLLHDPKNSILAADVLPYLGPDAVPALIGALSSTNSSIRYSGAWGISYSGSNGEPAIQLLVERLSDDSEATEVRMRSILALGKIGKQPDKVIPVLVTLLSHTNRGFSVRAARSIGLFATNATSAIPALLQAVNHEDENIVRAARSALTNIDPTKWPPAPTKE
jgi:HEAT repeat protein